MPHTEPFTYTYTAAKSPFADEIQAIREKYMSVKTNVPENQKHRIPLALLCGALGFGILLISLLIIL